jgi:nucleotide-binding universal stress UspA family protein
LFKHLLIPTDFSPSSARALRLGIELAKRFEAKVTLLHSFQIPVMAYAAMEFLTGSLAANIETAARAELDAALAEVRKKLPNADAVLREGDAWRQILATVDEIHADLVIMGTHGRHGLSYALLGSVAEKIVRLAHVPVMTVHDEDV